MTNYDKINCKQLFECLTKKNKEIDEQSFSELITTIFQLKEDDPLQFYILTHGMKAQKAGHIGINNLQNLFDLCKAKTVKDIKKHLPTLQKQSIKPNIFKETYKGTYPLFLISKTTTLDVDYAIALWSVLLKGKFTYLDDLQMYFQQLGQKRPKKIHKDLWNMMYQFSTVVRDINKDYNENDAWPVFIDNFVEWLKQRKQ